MSNSSQTNFFIVPEDWSAINVYFKGIGINFINVPILKIEHLFKEELNGGTTAHQIYLTKEDPGKKVVLSPQKEGYYVDVDNSEVIEFSRGGFYPNSDRILHRARLYTIFQCYNDDGDLVRKDEEYIKWVKGVYKQFKRNFLKGRILIKITLFLKMQLNGCRKIRLRFTGLA